MKDKKEVEKVALVKCKTYKQKEIDKSVKKVLRLLNFPVNKYKKVLIKPNVLGAYEENQEAIITNPSIVRALIKIFKGRQLIGESSFMDTERAFEKSGYDFKNLIVFEQEKLMKIKDDKAKILKNFYLPKILKQIDLMINVPKLKTHTLTKMTGAIKNLYGCIPGGMKQILHKKAHGGEKFSSLLIDIYQNLKPGLNIIDAVIAMEGEGPSSGRPKKVNLILASRNAVALDIVASKIMGFKASEIWTIKEAVDRGFYSGYKIEIVGDLKKLPNLKFKKPSLERRSLVRAALTKLVKENPILVNKDKCTRCGICMRKCPVKAITLKPYPVIDTKKCIRCFCCIEICPHHSLHLKETMTRRLIKKIRKTKRKS